MRIELNGHELITGATTLAELLHEQGQPASGVATALDGCFVPAASRATTALGEGMRVEVLAPMQGG